MSVSSLVIARHVVGIWCNDDTDARTHSVMRLLSEELPSSKRVVQAPVIPPGAKERRRLNHPTQTGQACMWNRERVMRDPMSENGRQGFYVHRSDVPYPQNLLE